MVSEDRLKELIETKNKQRAVFRADFVKQFTNPHRHAQEVGGTIVDPGVQRWMAMEATKMHFFKPTSRTGLIAFALYIVPVALTMYWVKTTRDAKEDRFRSGMVSYRDREYKFV